MGLIFLSVSLGFFRIYIVVFLNSILKFNIFKLFFFKKQLTSTLFIGTITIHPILFYSCMLIFLFKLTKMVHRYSSNLLPLRLFPLFLTLTLTLILGGFWGLQSTIWGYFWVNDAVEWLLLLTIIYTLKKLHSFNIFGLIYNHFLPIFFLFNLILVVRLNVFQTRHNFIEQQNISLMLLFSYSVFLFLLLSTKSKFKYSQCNFLFYFNIFPLYLIILIIYFYPLLSCKYFNIFLFSFFLKYFKPKFILWKLYLHLFFFSFIYVWSIYFNFFFLVYTKSLELILELPLIFNNIFLFNDFFSTSTFSFKLLESVSFKLTYSMFRQFLVLFGLNSQLFLNNFYLLVFIPLFFICKKGWI